MIRQRDEAFVLDTRALGEADLIVALLTEQHGKIRAVARAARRSRRRFGGLLEPLTRVRAAWLEQEGRELHRLDELEARRSFAEMQADPLCQAACAVLTDIVSALSHEGQADPEEFRLVGAVLETSFEKRKCRRLLMSLSLCGNDPRRFLSARSNVELAHGLLTEAPFSNPHRPRHEDNPRRLVYKDGANAFLDDRQLGVHVGLGQ